MPRAHPPEARDRADPSRRRRTPTLAAAPRRCAPPTGREPLDEGSEVVSTVLLQALVIIIVLAMLQIGFALHTRNMAISAAGEGARRGGLFGGDENEAIARTQEILSTLVGSSKEPTITAARADREGRDVLEVTVTTTLPILLNVGPEWLTVRGTSLVEDTDG